MAENQFSKRLHTFKKEFSENIDKVIEDSTNEMDIETLELMKYMLNNLRTRVRE